MSEKLKVAVITGGHPFDVPAVRDMFGRMTDFDVYIQDLDNWAVLKKDNMYGNYDMYDVFVFYNMHTWGVLSVRKDMDATIVDALNGLGESRQGIMVWHHALLAFPDIQVWSDITHSQNRRLRRFKPPEAIRNIVAQQDHPITSGLETWDAVDEIFLIDTPIEGSDLLITTDHQESMPVLGWAHEYRNARVFCYQQGHDKRAFTNPSFQKVLTRGIEWLAGRI
jgi:hypothetical protein